jgi:hypothetical protein
MCAIGENETTAQCPACHAAYHAECWTENGGCAIYGCSQVPATEQRQAIEIPVSYWGQEHKPCPACGQEILAAALRCRFCGAMFASARPQDQEEFRQQGERERLLPAARRTVLWIFILSVLSCTAPIGAVWGLVWYPAHRDDVSALPSVYSALCKIGLAVGVGQTVLIVLMSVLYAAFRT